MITAHKAESENEKARDKGRARSAMTTEPVKSTTELGNQIAKLMAALTRARQGNNPISAQNSPRQRGHGRGWMDRKTPGHPSSHNGQTGLGLTASAHSVSASHSTGTTSQGQGQNAQESKDSKRGTSNRKDPSSLQCFRRQGWGHPSKDFKKPVWGELRECSPTPCQHQPQQPTVGHQHSLADPKPKLTILKAAQKKGQPEVTPVPFLNPDPIMHLVGCSNKAPGIVNRQEMTTLIYLDAQVSSISSQFCGDLALQIQPLGHYWN